MVAKELDNPLSVKIDSRKQKAIYYATFFAVVLTILSWVFKFPIFEYVLEGIMLFLIVYFTYIYLGGSKGDAVFAVANGKHVIISTPAFLAKRKISIDIEDVLEVVTSGQRGWRKYLFRLKKGESVRINLSRTLGLSLSKKVEDDFLRFLKNVFGEIVHSQK